MTTRTFPEFHVCRLIDYCLTTSVQYFSYIWDENKLYNIYIYNYIEMRVGMGQLGQ
jgi:hypothetical protein